MKAEKKLGIWMDHARAHLMELTPKPMITKIMECKLTKEEEEHRLSSSEGIQHHKEQHQQSAFYKRLSAVIKNYEEVVLFGPTTAKNELANLLKWDSHFKGIKVSVKHADKMTENQQHAFVREHFLKKLTFS